MGFFSSSKSKSTLNWNSLTTLDQLNDLLISSNEKPVLLFKHSTRCSISDMVKNRLELYWDDTIGVQPVYLDLLAYRNISDEIASRFNVTHQSPQVLLIKNGDCIYHASHNEIDLTKIKQIL